MTRIRAVEGEVEAMGSVESRGIGRRRLAVLRGCSVET